MWHGVSFPSGDMFSMWQLTDFLYCWDVYLDLKVEHPPAPADRAIPKQVCYAQPHSVGEFVNHDYAYVYMLLLSNLAIKKITSKLTVIYTVAQHFLFT